MLAQFGVVGAGVVLTLHVDFAVSHSHLSPVRPQAVSPSIAHVRPDFVQADPAAPELVKPDAHPQVVVLPPLGAAHMASVLEPAYFTSPHLLVSV